MVSDIQVSRESEAAAVATRLRFRRTLGPFVLAKRGQR